MKQFPCLMDFVAVIYNLVHRGNAWRYGSVIECKGVFFNKVRLSIHGKNNKIIIGRKARLNCCSIDISGDNCLLIIGGGSTIISNTSFCLQDDNCKIEIGTDFTMEGGHIASTEGESIIIGNDCMFSGDIEIRNGDSHSILNNQTGKRINWAQPVIIGDKVWLTAHVRILKGSVIPHHSIIGNSTVISKKLDIPYAVYGGMPVRLLRTNIDWDRNRYKFIKE